MSDVLRSGSCCEKRRTTPSRPRAVKSLVPKAVPSRGVEVHHRPASRKSEALRAYGICSPTTLDNWIERYGHGILTEHKELLSQMGRRKPNTNTAVKGEIPELEGLRRELVEANKRRRAAELRAEAYSLMIDLAEKELKVAIRKKSATKCP